MGDAFCDETRIDGVNTGAGWTPTEISAVECATEQIEHSWSGELPLVLWTWFVWATATNRINRTQSSESAPDRAEPRALS